MGKVKSVFICQQCGAQFPKWQGKCTSCNTWDALVEEQILRDTISDGNRSTAFTRPVSLADVEVDQSIRILTTDEELNRVLGGGFVQGSVTLIAGEPGIGKSTLLLQVALQLNMPVLYVSGEESAQQIRLRADRLEGKNPQLQVLTATQTEHIIEACKQLSPALVIIDSIQTVSHSAIESAAGSVSQIRESAAMLIHLAKSSEIALIIVGHINKEGSIAGPKILEHMVDTVLQFEGDRHFMYRMIRSTKNRFGSANELGIYEMLANGLRQVSNPSEIFLTQSTQHLSGISIACILEGARPLFIETQALVAPAVYGTPQRAVNGIDTKRIQLLLAVLDKRGGFHFGARDVFINLAGGIYVNDPGIDLALLAALISSYEEKPLDTNICFIGELSLSGEIRSVSRMDARIAEAWRMGFTEVVVPMLGTDHLSGNSKRQLHKVSTVEDFYRSFF